MYCYCFVEHNTLFRSRIKLIKHIYFQLQHLNHSPISHEFRACPSSMLLIYVSSQRKHFAVWVYNFYMAQYHRLEDTVVTSEGWHFKKYPILILSNWIYSPPPPTHPPPLPTSMPSQGRSNVPIEVTVRLRLDKLHDRHPETRSCTVCSPSTSCHGSVSFFPSRRPDAVPSWGPCRPLSDFFSPWEASRADILQARHLPLRASAWRKPILCTVRIRSFGAPG